jgi:hypothetical protein
VNALGRVLVSALVATSLSSHAHAQHGSNVALAESLYQEGKRLVGEGKFDLACPKFAESYKLEPATGTLLNIAACYESAGKFGTAWANYNEALVAAKREGQDFRVKFATEHLAALEDKLTRFVLELAPQADVPGLEVKLDGQLVPAGAFGIPAPIDPGIHTVEATAPGRKPVRFELTANAPKQLVTATIPLLESASVEPAPAPAAVSPKSAAPTTMARAPAPATTTRGGTLRSIGYVVGAAGLLGVGTGGVLYFVARAQNETAKSQCTIGENGCRNEDELTRHDDNVDAAETNHLFSLVSFGVGGAALATGLVLVLLGGPTRERAAFLVTPSVDERGAGLSAVGRF